MTNRLEIEKFLWHRRPIQILTHILRMENQNNHPSISEVNRNLAVGQSHTSNIVNKFEDFGFVIFKIGGPKNNSKFCHLTEKGRFVAKQVQGIKNEIRTIPKAKKDGKQRNS